LREEKEMVSSDAISSKIEEIKRYNAEHYNETLDTLFTPNKPLK
jgi:hypothetical protein